MKSREKLRRLVRDRAAAKMSSASVRVVRARGTTEELFGPGAVMTGTALRSLPVSSLAAGMWWDMEWGGSYRESL
jgi:hypothetical protein